jgi:dTMP kinase
LRGELELDDRAAHLLFSADRYNVIALIEQKLKAGITVVLDRYLYSGIAYSAARGLSIDWCISVDDGLPTPDLVFFLDVSVMRDRDGGSERYEETLFQLAVYRSFTSLFNRSCLREVVCTVADQSVASTHVFIYTRCSDEYDRMKGFGVFQI